MTYKTLPGGTVLHPYHEWSLYTFNLESFPCKTIEVVTDIDYEYGYGVRFPKATHRAFSKYVKWSFETFGPSEYEEATNNLSIWFRSEKNRTMFLLKWGHQ